jgi:glycosyltransferase involved in cell wall biosynthesis
VSEAPLQLVISGLPLSNLEVGQGVYTYRIIRGLLRRAPELHFRVLIPAHFTIPDEIPEQIVLRLSGMRGLAHPLVNGLYWGQRILSYARRLPPQTVFHSPAPIAGFGRAATAVVTIHDCLYRTFPHYYGRSGIRKLNLLASEGYAAGSTLVLTQSEFSRDQLARQTAIPMPKIRVLSPWVEQSFLQASNPLGTAQLRTKLNLPERFWLYIGGYDYRKNVEFLIRSYARARQSCSLPPLVLAGEVPRQRHRVLCDVMGALERTGLRAEDVLLAGVITLKDLPDLYRGASLVIYPSLMEGFGIPPIEAMATGTPILASNRSSIPEVIHKEECLFDPTDESELAEKLIRAGQSEMPFRVELPPAFTEEFGISRYLQLIAEAGECRPNG